MTIQEHEQELADLAIFFQTARFPQTPFPLNNYITITGDPRVMIEMKISSIQRYKGNDTVRDSLFKHLRELKAICEAEANNPSV